jgi:hypothetical protein
MNLKFKMQPALKYIELKKPCSLTVLTFEQNISLVQLNDVPRRSRPAYKVNLLSYRKNCLNCAMSQREINQINPLLNYSNIYVAIQLINLRNKILLYIHHSLQPGKIRKNTMKFKKNSTNSSCLEQLDKKSNYSFYAHQKET